VPLNAPKRRPGYLRHRANPNRRAQQIWTALRVIGSRGLTTAELSEITGQSSNTVKHLLARWHREGLVGAQENPTVTGWGSLNPGYLWTLALDIGPIAPVLRGSVGRGAGYTNPN